MRARTARLLTRLYPREWRDRYGSEFEELLRTDGGGLLGAADVVWAALSEHVFPTRGGSMDRRSRSFGEVLRQPSAFVPMVMSLAALGMVLGTIAVYGAARDKDEGIVAHVWQLLMAGQAPIVLYFLLKWLPRAPRQTLGVLSQQIGAALASLGAVFFFHLG